MSLGGLSQTTARFHSSAVLAGLSKIKHRSQAALKSTTREVFLRLYEDHRASHSAHYKLVLGGQNCYSITSIAFVEALKEAMLPFPAEITVATGQSPPAA